MFVLSKMYGWPSTQHAIDGSVGSENGLSNIPYGWQRWEKWCLAYDLDMGKTIAYVDGKEDGNIKRNLEAKDNADLKRANSKIRNPDVITDVLIGCQLTDDIAGTQIIK